MTCAIVPPASRYPHHSTTSSSLTSTSSTTPDIHEQSHRFPFRRLASSICMLLLHTPHIACEPGSALAGPAMRSNPAPLFLQCSNYYSVLLLSSLFSMLVRAYDALLHQVRVGIPTPGHGAPSAAETLHVLCLLPASLITCRWELPEWVIRPVQRQDRLEFPFLPYCLCSISILHVHHQHQLLNVEHT